MWVVVIVLGGLAAGYFLLRPKPEVVVPTEEEALLKPVTIMPVVIKEEVLPKPTLVTKTVDVKPVPVVKAEVVTQKTTATLAKVEEAEKIVAVATTTEELKAAVPTTIKPYLEHPISYETIPEEASPQEKSLALTSDAFKWQEAQRKALGLETWETGYPMVWWSATIQYAQLHSISIKEAYQKRTGFDYPKMDR